MSAAGVRRRAALGLFAAALLAQACAETATRGGDAAGIGADRAEEGDPAAYVVAPGESFQVRLAARPSTGFTWELGTSLDEAVVRLVSTTFVPGGEGQLGAAGTSVWTFEAVGPGRAAIVLVYRRPFEPEVAPARVAVYSVAVS